MTKLVHEEQADEAEPEPPAAEERRGADREDHRAEGVDRFQLQQEYSVLAEERTGSRERPDQLAQEPAAARLADRLIRRLYGAHVVPLWRCVTRVRRRGGFETWLLK